MKESFDKQIADKKKNNKHIHRKEKGKINATSEIRTHVPLMTIRMTCEDHYTIGITM